MLWGDSMAHQREHSNSNRQKKPTTNSSYHSKQQRAIVQDTTPRDEKQSQAIMQQREEGGLGETMPTHRKTMIVDLPDAVLGHCLAFSGDPKAFRALELSCKRFRVLLSEDSIWKHCCPNLDCTSDENKPTSDTYYRDEAFRDVMYKRMRHWQGPDGTSILYNAFEKGQCEEEFAKFIKKFLPELFERYCTTWSGPLGSSEFQSLVEQTLASYQRVNVCDNYFALTPEAATALIELVENNLLGQLSNAFLLAVHRTPEEGVYPSVSASDFILQDKTRQNATMFKQDIVPVPNHFRCDTKMKSTIVRRLAFRAGIAKCDNDLYDLVWGTILNMIILLIMPGCLELSEKPNEPWKQIDGHWTDSDDWNGNGLDMNLFAPSENHPKRYLADHQKVKDVTPKPLYLPPKGRPGEGEALVRGHFIILRHITEAAKSLGIPYSVLLHSDRHESAATFPYQEVIDSMYCGPGADIESNFFGQADSKACVFKEEEENESEEEAYENILAYEDETDDSEDEDEDFSYHSAEDSEIGDEGKNEHED